MSAVALGLVGLPAEILEHVLLHLLVQDIIKMEVVSRHFRALIHDSPTLQYRCELFAAGLIDNPSNSCDLVERRKLCEEYVHKWSDAATVVKRIHKLPPNQPTFFSHPVGRNTILLRSRPDNGLNLFYIPPVASRKPINGWNIPPFSFNLLDTCAYHPDNVLCGIEPQEDLLRIHLFNLQDGSPYHAPPSNPMTCAIPRGMLGRIRRLKLAITGSRVALCLSHPDAALPNWEAWTVLVWDRKTGDLILDVSPKDRNGFVGSEVVFLDEFRIMVSARYTDTHPPELIVFDTLIPQGCPGNSRRFSLPPRYGSEYYSVVHVDRDRYLGKLDKDVPFITDPTQAILVVEVLRPMRRSVSLVVRMQALIENVCSTCTDDHIPWDEWGRGAAIMESPRGPRSPIHVHGTHVVVLAMRSLYDCRVHVFDFGRRRRGSLPLLDRGDGGAKRRVLFEDGREFILEADQISWDGVQSLGNGAFFHSQAVAECPRFGYGFACLGTDLL